jgi:hypothetical protein
MELAVAGMPGELCVARDPGDLRPTRLLGRDVRVPSYALPSFLGPTASIRLRAPASGILAFFSGSATTGAALRSPLPVEKQSEDEWCWASVGAAVHRYLSRQTLRQCDVACLVKGRNDCCSQPSSDPCDAPDSLIKTLTLLRNFASSLPNGRASPAEIDRELRADRPLCCGLTNGQLGHFVVITGWYPAGGETGLLIRDPALGGEEKPVLYRKLTLGYPQSGWQWRETYLTRRSQV